MKAILCAALVLAASALAAPAVAGADHSVPGQKLDSGLGELPHYSRWADPTGRQPVRHRVAGESLDSGLGELPHYSQWKDPTGKNPLDAQPLTMRLARH